MNILLVHGPNLNLLGTREPEIYGEDTLKELMMWLETTPVGTDHAFKFFQSNHEGSIVEFIHQWAEQAEGVIINAGALTQVGYSILDAILDAKLPLLEVHLSNIHAREEFRQKSVFASSAIGQIAGFGPAGYIYALEHLSSVIDR